MMPEFIAMTIIAFVPTYLISRVLLFASARWSDRLLQLFMVHSFSIVFVMILAFWAFDYSNPSEPAEVILGPLTFELWGRFVWLAQMVWLGIDLWRIVIRPYLSDLAPPTGVRKPRRRFA